MLKIVSLVVAVAALSAAGHSQWVRQAPYPANEDLNAVHFITPEIGFIGGKDNILMRTTDGGATWTQASAVTRSPFGFGDPLWHIQFVNANDGFAMGNRAYRTNDAGASWQQVSSPDTIYDFDFLTPQRGFASSRRAIYVTSNAGTSWTEVLPFSTDHFVTDFDFYSENNALVVGRVNSLLGVFRSTNSGQNWQRISTLLLDRIVFMTEQVVIGTKGAIYYRSVDGGVNWVQTHSEFDPISQAEVEAVTRISDTSAATIGFDARILITHDSGLTWTLVKEPTGVWGFELDIHFPTTETGYAVGRLGLIYKTTDGGSTWTQINNGAARALFRH